jgi:hypothetical protein
VREHADQQQQRRQVRELRESMSGVREYEHAHPIRRQWTWASPRRDEQRDSRWRHVALIDMVENLLM